MRKYTIAATVEAAAITLFVVIVITITLLPQSSHKPHSTESRSPKTTEDKKVEFQVLRVQGEEKVKQVETRRNVRRSCVKKYCKRSEMMPQQTVIVGTSRPGCGSQTLQWSSSYKVGQLVKVSPTDKWICSAVNHVLAADR